MQKYEFLPHTADVKFIAYGKTLEEAFTNAALATTAVMSEDTINPVETKDITVNADNKEKLLYDFLEELIFLVDTEAYLVADVKHISIQEEKGHFTLTATVAGDTADNYEITTHIKAVTYSDMFIKEEENKVTIQVVHDI